MEQDLAATDLTLNFVLGFQKLEPWSRRMLSLRSGRYRSRFCIHSRTISLSVGSIAGDPLCCQQRTAL